MESEVHIGFGSGGLQGVFTTDNIMLGDPNDLSNQLVIEDFHFGLVESQDGIFDGQFDAIIGMAYPSMAQEGKIPFFD